MADAQAARDLVRLMAWLSPSFPVGAFGYSHGLEQAIADGAISNAASLAAWIGGLLAHGGGWTDIILLTAAHRAQSAGDGSRLGELDALALALAPSAERLRETRDQGAAFLAATACWAAARDEPPPPFRTAAYPVAVGAVIAACGIDLAAAQRAYLQAFGANLVAVAVRVAGLGQSAGVTALALLEPLVLRVAALAASSDIDHLGGCGLLSDIASMRHETLQTRLCIS